MENKYLFVDNFKNLWICDDSSNYDIEWTTIFENDIRSFHPDNNSMFYSIEVLKFSHLKSNNYKIEATISGTCISSDVKYLLLLNNYGQILKKKII